MSASALQSGGHVSAGTTHEAAAIGLAAAATVAVIGSATAAYVSHHHTTGVTNGKLAAEQMSTYNLMVFKESTCRTTGTLVKHPRQESVACLKAMVEAKLGISDARLFCGATKEEVTGPEALAELDKHTKGGLHVLVLVATSDGKPLSGAALCQPALQAVPYGSRPLPLVGNAFLAKGASNVPGFNFYTNLFTPDKVAKWGRTVQVVLPSSAAPSGPIDGYETASMVPVVMTCDPCVVAELLERQEDFPKMWNDQRQLKIQKFTGNGLFTSSNTDMDWQTAHGLLPRGFNQIRVKNYFPVILDKTRTFMYEWSKLPEGTLITDVNDWLTCMTADAVTKAAMGLDMQNVEKKAGDLPLHPFIVAFRLALSVSFGSVNVGKEFGRFSAWNPWFDRKAAIAAKGQEAKAACEQFVDEMVEATRKKEIGGSTSIITAMLEDKSSSNGEYVRLSNIYGQLMNIMIAGHETTAATLGFTMAYLAQNPDCEKKALDEIKAVMGGRTEPTAQDIPKLQYVEACFREALRLHPAVVQLSRDAGADTTLAGKYLLRRGQRILVNTFALHRQEDQWGGKFGNVNKYNPERFMPGAADERHPNAYAPFGFGVRSCIGQQFALWEAKTFLSMILPAFSLKTLPGYVPESTLHGGGAAPVPGNLQMYIYPRAGSRLALRRSQSLGLKAPKSTEPGVDGSVKALGSDAANGVTAAANGVAMANGADVQGGMHHDTPLLVLYGSNSGTCECFALQLANLAQGSGFKATTANLDSIVTSAFPSKGSVVIVTSTYNGQPPDNAVQFSKWLKAKASKPGSLSSLSYAVFGVGNSQWQTYQAFPHLVDTLLAEAGASRLRDMGTSDTELNSFEELWESWSQSLIPDLLVYHQVDAPQGAESASKATASDQPRLKLRVLGAGEVPATKSLTPKDVVATMRKEAGKALESTDGYYPLDVTANRELQGPGSDRSTRHVELLLPPALTYTAGDHLEVLANNAPQVGDDSRFGTVGCLIQCSEAARHYFARQHYKPYSVIALKRPTPSIAAQLHICCFLVDALLVPVMQLVNAALDVLGLEGSELVEWSHDPAAAGGPARGMGKKVQLHGIGPIIVTITARLALTWLADLSAVPSKRVVAALADSCECPPEKRKLADYATEDGYKKKVLGPKLTLIELLATFSSSPMTLPTLLNLLPRLAPRYYSISSSPLAAKNNCTVTVGLVEYTTPTGRVHRGAASDMLASTAVGGGVLGTVRGLQSTFRLPKNPATPVIMIGPGTGIAPMMGFLQERQQLIQSGTAVGEAHMFFGCRTLAHDYIYKEELAKYQASGALSKLHVAFSRDGPMKVYVQDLLLQQGAAVWQLLEAGAYIYVCGDAKRMAPDVRNVLKQIAEKCGGLNESSSEIWMAGLRESKRYLEDVWAG
eukprot:jgi/Chrzof1/7835/Cz02g38090.t1